MVHQQLVCHSHLEKLEPILDTLRNMLNFYKYPNKMDVIIKKLRKRFKPNDIVGKTVIVSNLICNVYDLSFVEVVEIRQEEFFPVLYRVQNENGISYWISDEEILYVI